MKISEVIKNEMPKTCQIQQEAVFQDQRVQTVHPTKRIAQVSTEPIPDQLKHRLVQRRLTKQMMRQSNIVKPTSDDIQIARDRVVSLLKRADIEHQEKLDRDLRRQDRHRH